MHKYLTKSIGTALSNTFASAVFAMVLIPLIIRNIGMAKYGTWTLLFLFVGLSATLDIGIPRALVYLIPKEKNRAEVNRLFTASGFIIFCMMFLVLLLTFAVIFFEVPIWGRGVGISRPLSNLLLFSGANILCCGLLQSLCTALLEAHYKIHVVNIISFILSILSYSVIFIITIFSSRIEHLLYASNTVYITVTLLSVVLSKRYTEIKLSRFGTHDVQLIFSKGKDFFIIGLITSVSLPLMRYLVVYLTGDMTTCGIYDIALKIAMMASGALTCFSIPLFSLFSGYGEKGIGKIKRVLFYVVVLLAGLFLLGVSAYLLFGERILDFALAAHDTRLFNTSLILLLGLALTAVFEPYVRALWALGHAKKCIAIRFCVLVINIALVFLLSFIADPLYRISFAIGFSFSLGGLSFFVLFYQHYRFRMNYFDIPSEKKYV